MFSRGRGWRFLISTLGFEVGALRPLYDHHCWIRLPLIEQLMSMTEMACFENRFVMNIYVGNLSYQLSDDELRRAFEQFGDVSSATIIMDKATGRSKGFGFVEMPDQASGEQAIKELDGADLKGRNIKVNEARPRTEDPPARRARRF